MKNHPQGLTIKELADSIGIHRQTVTKYVLELKGADTLVRRRVGSATLHYLQTTSKSNKGQASGYLIIPFLVIGILLTASLVYAQVLSTPTITSPSDGASFNKGSTFTLTASASCSVARCNGVQLTANLPSGLSSNPSIQTCGGLNPNETCTKSWTVSTDSIGTYSITVTASAANAASTTSSAVSATVNAVCGDNVCEGSETTDTCSQDCAAPTPPAPPGQEKKEEKGEKGREESEKRRKDAEEKLKKIKEEAEKTRALISIPAKYKDAPVNFEFPATKMKVKTPFFKSWDRKLVLKGVKQIEKIKRILGNETIEENQTIFRDISAALPTQFSLLKPTKWEKLSDDPNFDLTDVDAAFDEKKFTIKFKVSGKIVTNMIITDYYNSLGLIKVLNDGNQLLASRVSPVSKVFFAAPDEQLILTGDVKFFPILLGLQVGEEFYYFMTAPFYPKLMSDTSGLKDITATQSRTKFDLDFQYQLGDIKIIKATVPKVLDLSAVEAGYKEDILTINETDYTSVIISLGSNVLNAFKAHERVEVTYPQESQAIVCHYWDFKSERCNRNWETVSTPENVGLSAFGFIVPKKSGINFDRNLDCHKCGQHKAPPLVGVNMTITVNVPNPAANSTLSDYFPADWTIIDINGGNVSAVNSSYNKITWNVGDVETSVSRDYVVQSPQRTFPPTKYDFFTQFKSQTSGSWDVIVADPTVTYTITNSSNYKVFNKLTDGIATPPAFTAAWDGANTSNGCYTNVSTSDNVYCKARSGGTNLEPWTRFNFTISEAEADIDWIELTMEQRGAGGAAETCSFIAANFTNSGWFEFGAATNTEATRTYNATTNAEAIKLIDGNGQLVLLSEGTNKDAGEDCDVDFVQVTVGSTVVVADTTPPQLNTNITSFSSQEEYSSDKRFMFNITVTEDNVLESVLFETNISEGTLRNHSAYRYNFTGTSYTYSVNFTNSSAGNYSFRWYANDTTGNPNSTDIAQYIIVKNTSLVNSFTFTINGTAGDVTRRYPNNVVNIVASDSSSGDSDASYSITRDNITQITSNSIEDLANGTYNYQFNTSITLQNYTYATLTRQLLVNKGVLNDTGLTEAQSVTSGSESTVTSGISASTFKGDDDVTYQLWRNTSSTTYTLVDNTLPLSEAATLAFGLHNYIVNTTAGAFSNWTANASINTTSVTVLTPPQFSNNFTTFPSATQYSPDKLFQFNMTVTDDGTIDTVLFETNMSETSATLRNHTARLVNSNYTVNFTNVSASNYTYRWYANDTGGSSNSTERITYTVIKNSTRTLTLTIDGSANDATKKYPNNVVTVAASNNTKGDNDATYILTVGNTSVGNNTQIGSGGGISLDQDLGNDTWTFQYNTTQSTLQNYTYATLTRQLLINKGVLNDTGLTEAQTVTYETSSTVTSGIAATTFKGDDDVTYQLWRGNSLIDDTLTLTESRILGQGTNNYKVNTTVGATNWTANASINTTTVTVNAKAVQVSLSGINNITYPNTNVTISCSAVTVQSTVNTCVLWRDNTDVTSASANGNNSVWDLAAGLYEVKVNGTAGSGNYSANDTGLTIYFNIAKNTTRMTLSISPSSPVTYPTSTTATGNESNKGDADVTYRLYREIGNDTGNAYEVATLGAGTHLYRLNASSGANWSVNATGETLTLTVNQGAPQVKLFLNNTEGNRTYTQGAIANISANTSSTPSIPTVNIFANYTGVNTFTQIASASTWTANLTDTNNLNTLNYSIIANITGNANWTDNSTGINYFLKINPAPDTTLPQFNTNYTNVASGTQYSFARNYGFQTAVTDNDAVDVVLFEANFNESLRNYTITAVSGVYSTNYTSIPAGDYQYRWYANDTSGNGNNTGIIPYSVAKNTTLLSGLTLTIDGSASDATKTYPNNVVTVACSESNAGDGDASYVCSRDNTTSLGTGSSVSVAQDLDSSATTYKFQYNITQSTLQNYSAPVSLTRQLTVNKGTLNDSALNASQTVTYETQSTVTSGITSTTFKGSGDITFQLFRENTLVDNTLPLSEAIVLGQGTNNYKVNTTAGAFSNWTANASINTTTVTVNAKAVQVSLNGINNITYPNVNVTINCGAATVGSTVNTCVLLRNGTDVTSTENNTVMDRAVGLYNFTVNGTAGSSNYSANTTGLTSFWNVAKNTTRMTLSISPSSPVTYPTSTTATGSESNKGDADVTYRLYREIGNDTGSTSETNTFGGGTHLYRFNASSGANWSVNATGETLTLTVNQGAPQVKLFLNNTEGNRTYNQGAIANISANTSVTQSIPTVNIFANYTGVNTFTQIASGTGSAFNLTDTNNLNGATNYTIIANITGNANWTDNSTGVNYTFYVIPSNTAPVIRLITPSSVAYISGQTINYTIVAEDTDGAGQLDVIVLRFNDTTSITALKNYTNTSAGTSINSTARFYEFTFTVLPAGDYQVKGFANDTSNAVANTAFQSYSISKASQSYTFTIDGSASDKTVTYPNSIVTVACSNTLSGIGDATFALNRDNNTQLGTGTSMSVVQDLDGSATAYKLLCNTTQSTLQNYTYFALERQLTVNKGTLNDSALNASQTVTYETSSTVTSGITSTTFKGSGDVTFQLWRGNTLADNTLPLSEAIVLGQGTNNYKVNTTAGAFSNWTANASINTTTVTVNAKTVQVSLSGINNITYPNLAGNSSNTINCGAATVGSTVNTCVLLRNGTDVTSAENNTVMDLAAGLWNITVTGTAGSGNYSANTTGISSFWNVARNTTYRWNLFTSAPSSPTYETATDTGIAESNKGDSDVSVNLYLNDNTSVNSSSAGGSLSHVAILPAATNVYKINTTSGTFANWTGNTTGQTVNVIVSQKAIQLSLNGINNITYPNVNVTINCGSQSLSNIPSQTGCILWRNSTNTTNTNNTIHDLAAGLYEYKANSTVYSGNYSLNDTGVTIFFNIAKNTSRVLLTISPSSPVTYPTSTTATGNESNKGDADVTYRLYREIGNDTGNAYEVATLGAGTHLYRLNASSGANWSVNATGETLTLIVNKANVAVRLKLNGTEGGRSYSNAEDVFANITGFNHTLVGNGSTQIRLYANFTSANVFEELAAVGTTVRMNITNVNNLAAGAYVVKANFSGNANWTDNSTGVNYTLTVTQTNRAPTIRLIVPASATYSSGQTINYTIVTEDADGAGELNYTILRFNDTTSITALRNYTNTSAGTSINSTARFYEFTFTVLPAGDYQVKGFANDTSNAVANTAFQSYSISKNTSLSLTLTIDGTAGDVTKTYPNNVVTVACSETNNGDTDASYVCSRDNATSLGTGSSVSVVQDLTASATAYSFQYNITQSTLQNYTAPVSLTRQLTVNKGILNDTGLNASQTVTYETQSTVTSGIASTTFKGDDDVTYQLWRGNSLVDNTLPLSEALVLGQGTNNYKVNTTVGAFTNWTANASINTTTVTVNAKTVQVSLNGINNITYPNTNVTINCGAATIASTANTCVLLRNGTDVTSASNNTVMDLAAGLWNITVTGTAGSGNYSANTTGLTSFFNIAKNTTRVTLSISPSSPVTYLTSTTATGSEANKGDSDVTYRLYRESGNDTGAASETITLGAGTHLYRFNATSGSNWSVNATGETLTLTVNQGASDIALYLNGTRADKTYAQYQFANFTAQLLNATGKTISLTSNMTGFGILSGSSSIILNTTNLTQNGTFNMTAYWSGDANFTSDSETWYATSSPLTLTASLNSLSPTSINQAETSTAKAGCSVTGNSITNVYIELQADGAPIQTTAGGNLRVNGSNAVSAGSLADGGVVNATWTITGNNAGSYSIRTKCNSTEAGDANSGTSTLTVVDVTLPSASNALNSTPSTYNPNVKSHFNITWTDDVGISKVFLESNYTGTARNYTMNRIPSTNVYNYNETLPAGGFYWKSYANDTANNMVASSTITFIISKDMPMIVPVFNNRTERHGEEFNASNTSHNFYEFGESFDKGIILNLTANISVSSLELRLSANYTGVNQDIATGTGVVTNLTDTGNLQLGVYNVTAYYTGGNSNYSAVSNAFFLFVHSKYTNQTINFTAFVPTFVNASVANVTFSFVTNSTITLAGVNTTIEKVNPVHTEIPHVAIGRYVLLNASEDLRNTLSYYIFNISYLESEVPADVDESTLRLYFFNGTGWMRFASAGDGVDTANNVVYGNITHFSEFGVGGLKATGQSCTAGSDCATGICCSSICSASCGATTTTTPPSTGGGGTTPISPGGPVIILPKGIISVAKTPILVSVGTGDSNIVNIKIKNTGTTTLHNLRLSALGEANSWISVSPERVNLLTNEAATFTLAISIPATVTSQDYQVEMDINSDEINDKSTFILRVVSFSSHQERPLITRTAEIDLEAVETAVTIKIINPTRSYAVVQITEAIDKQIAKSADDINFITKPTSILEKDPQVLWNVKDIKAGETRTIFYTASKIPSFSELVFWPFDEITLIKERFPKGMKVVRVLTPTMYGNKDILKITVQNEDVDSHTLKIMPEFPEDWTVEPKDIEEVLPSKKQKEYTLTLDSSRAKLGSYIIQITFVWDGAEIIKEYSITNKSIFDRIVDLIVSLGNYLKQLLGL